MNKTRRAELEKGRQQLKIALDIIESVKNDEEESFDNLSEGLQQTMRGEIMEENISTLEDIIETISETIKDISTIL